PHCIFTPPTPSSAAFALRTLSTHSTPFAIRSGGHSMNPGFSSTSSGVLVSLKHLDQISLDTPAGTITIGAGNTWGAVYRFLSPLGLTVAGGRGSSVGVGGYSLG
ncbi:FAD-binding domain-containing protein, partial [Wilcoxina mikolae CBS 423.85]